MLNYKMLSSYNRNKVEVTDTAGSAPEYEMIENKTSLVKFSNKKLIVTFKSYI